MKVLIKFALAYLHLDFIEPLDKVPLKNLWYPPVASAE